jgi:hypothetical protein
MADPLPFGWDSPILLSVTGAIRRARCCTTPSHSQLTSETLASQRQHFTARLRYLINCLFFMLAMPRKFQTAYIFTKSL